MAKDQQILEQLTGIASESSVPIAEMTMEQMAAALGMTRMTLYRKAGTREQIVAALNDRGIVASRQQDVFERVIASTAALLREQPIAGLTLEQISNHAGCSLPALYARFNNREGVLKAVIERHSPLVPMQELVATGLNRDDTDLRHDVRLLYRTLITHLQKEWPVMRSFLAELLSDPGSEVGTAVREWYVPQAREAIFPVIARHMERGTMRRLPIAIVFQALAAPIGVHVASRSFVVNELGLDLPDIEGTIEVFTDMFCRAVEAEDPHA